MMEETNARHSAAWKPHSTFAEEMGLTHKGLALDVAPEDVHTAVVEKVAV